MNTIATAGQMMDSHNRNSLVSRGIVALVFGLIVLIWTGVTLDIFTSLFGIFVIIDGLTALAISLVWRHTYSSWWVLFLCGWVGIVIGLITIFWPEITDLIVLYMVAAWAIFIGVTELISGFAPEVHLKQGWPLILSGIVSLLLGAYLFFSPNISILTVVWLIGLYALVYGGLTLIRAFLPRRVDVDDIPVVPAS
jgi:uncharacterized membrane protein HdeD (DUF308 family)